MMFAYVHVWPNKFKSEGTTEVPPGELVAKLKCFDFKVVGIYDPTLLPINSAILLQA